MVTRREEAFAGGAVKVMKDVNERHLTVRGFVLQDAPRSIRRSPLQRQRHEPERRPHVSPLAKCRQVTFLSTLETNAGAELED